MQEQLKLNIIETVSTQPSSGTRLYYMPHHCVLRETHATTKIRVVYDASSKARKNMPSLNDIMYRGPVVLQDLVGLLLRFRLHPIAVCSDLEKAFLQVGLQDSERDCTRFLWIKDLSKPVTEDNLQILRFARVCFGVIASPFLLGATIIYHLRQSSDPIAREILDGLYVDNVFVGKTTVNDAIDFHKNAKEMFNRASMNLREFVSNSREFLDLIPEKDKATAANTSVLGVTWLVQTDELQISQMPSVTSKALTKRTLLHEISRIFDPMGWVAPVTMKGKLLMQEIWKLKLDWDSQVPTEVESKWTNIKRDLQDLKSIKIPRYIGYNVDTQAQLHCFCDSSGLVYSACLYIVLNDNDPKLLMCKNRVAPIKKITIPRLELMAAVIGVRLLKFVTAEMKLSIKRKVLWSDSKCVLHWIQGKRLQPVFVENRLKEIRMADGVEFRYVPTYDNPADLPTRGMTAAEIRESKLWWLGPQCLANETSWPDALIITAEETEEQVLEEHVCVSVEHEESTETILDLNRFSSLSKALRVLAYCFRFVNRARKIHVPPSTVISADELKLASTNLVKQVQRCEFTKELRDVEHDRSNNIVRQLGLFIDDDGVVRCKGRLANSDLSMTAKTPALLPRNHQLSRLIIMATHKRILHAGVSHTLADLRHSYWVVQGRSQVRKVIKDCRVCRKWQAKPYKSPEAPPLPRERVYANHPFEVVGVDHFGPLYVRSAIQPGTNKVYVCLFTCSTTRAVHLEVALNLSAEEFINCFRRFISRRGTPRLIISDNAKAFKVSNIVLKKLWGNIVCGDEVQSYISSRGISWKFIVEKAPNMGGFYERLIGLVKSSLKKTLGNACPKLDKLQAVISEIEAQVNSRPLTYVGADVNDGPALTPNHFLGVYPKVGTPQITIEEDDNYKTKKQTDSKSLLLETWKKGQRLLDRYWSVWQKEYLTALREKHMNNPRLREQDLKPNVHDVVLIKEHVPRGQWRLAIVTKLNISADNQIRSASVKLGNGNTIQRPLNLLVPLEYSNETDRSKKVLSLRANSSDTRPSRKAAITARDRITKVLASECHD